MWCPQCAADLPVQASADGLRLMCVQCGMPVALTQPRGEAALAPEAPARVPVDAGMDAPRIPSILPRERPTGAVVGIPAAPHDRDAERAFARWAAPDPLAEMLGPEPIAVGLAGARRSRATRGPFPGSDGDAPSVLPRRVDAAHERTPSLPAPAADSARGHAPTGKPSPSDHQGAWLGLAGQICAYAGVAVLTAGSGLLIVGHYGGPAAYAPYGWLISSVGQMLILLGVITLVSNGMDQIARQLGARIDALSTRMAGTAREFHGPHAGPPKPHGASAAPAATRPPLDAAST